MTSSVEALIEADHPVGVAPGGDGVVDLPRALGVGDEFLDPRGGDQDLDGGHHALAVGAGEQPLGDHALEDGDQLQPGLLLLVGRIQRDDAVDGLGGVDRVQGRQHQVSGLRGRHGDVGGLEIAHLTDQHDVGVLPQHRPEGLGEGGGIETHLSLVDDALSVTEGILDRVFDGDDVAGPAGVDVVDHGGQRGGLARSGDAGDQDQTALLVGQLQHPFGQVQLLERGHIGRDEPQHHAHVPALLKHVDPITGSILGRVGQVDVPGLLVAVPQPVRHHRECELADHLSRQGRHVSHRAQIALYPKNGRKAGLEMDVRGAQMPGCLQYAVQRGVHLPAVVGANRRRLEF